MEMFLWSLLAAGGSYIFLSIGWWLLLAIANWRVFTKAGEAGWKSFIPILSGHVSYRIAWHPAFYWIGIVLAAAANTLNSMEITRENVFVGMLAVLFAVAYVVITAMQTYKLARAFGKGIGFTIGLIVLEPIFMMIIAFGSARYERTDRR